MPEEADFFPRGMFRHPEFRQGAMDMLAISPGFAAWGVVTGVAMVKAGLSVPMALAMNLLVYAGSAQLAALPLITSNAGIGIVVLAGICVNLRFLIFSLQWRPFLARFSLGRRLVAGYLCGDTNYVLFMKRFPMPEPGPRQMAYFWGLSLTNWVLWQVPAIIGIVLADVIPPAWGLGFAATLAILALVFSMLQGAPNWTAMIVAGAAAVAAVALPFDLNLVVAIAAAIAAAALVDWMQQARSKRRGAARA